jgi:hypothetical protein
MAKNRFIRQPGTRVTDLRNAPRGLGVGQGTSYNRYAGLAAHYRAQNMNDDLTVEERIGKTFKCQYCGAPIIALEHPENPERYVMASMSSVTDGDRKFDISKGHQYHKAYCRSRKTK